MSSESAAANPDPLKAVADALDAAARAASEGVEGTRSTLAGAMPEVERQASRLLYNSCYYLAYGVVFPTALLARAIPKDNAVVHGFVDGAQAALDMVDEMKGQRASLAEPAPAADSGPGEPQNDVYSHS